LRSGISKNKNNPILLVVTKYVSLRRVSTHQIWGKCAKISREMEKSANQIVA